MADPWKQLRKKYVDDGIVLALGAGVSKRCGLPDWRELLVRLAESMPADDRPPVEKLIRRKMSLPAVAALLRKKGEQPMAFASRVRKALYRGFDFLDRGWKDYGQEYVEFVRKENPTLRAAAALCIKIGKSGKPKPNPLVRAVVTFNLDALFQTYIRASYAEDEEKLIRTVERASALPKRGRINLYHVHGFLRFDRKWEDPTKNSPDALVLGEHEYFDVFDNSTGIFTYTLLHLLREHSFLFIGLGMRDDNLRRLLHYSRRELIGAYRAEGEENPERSKKKKLNRHFAVLERPKAPEVEQAESRSLEGLGVNPLWVQRFSEIPVKLEELYRSGRGDWDAVWKPKQGR